MIIDKIPDNVIRQRLNKPNAMQFEQVRLHCIRLLRIFALNRLRTTDNRYIIYESRTFGSVAGLSDITSDTSPAATTAGAESPRIRKT